jgi:hypothetical protein
MLCDQKSELEKDLILNNQDGFSSFVKRFCSNAAKWRLSVIQNVGYPEPIPF